MNWEPATKTCSLRAVARLEEEWSEASWQQPSRTRSIWDTSTDLTVNFTEQLKPLHHKQHNLKLHESLITDQRLSVQKSWSRRTMLSQSQPPLRRTNYGVMPQVHPIQEHYWHWLYQSYCCTRDDYVKRTDCDVSLVLLVLSEDSHIAILWWNTHI